MTDRDDIIRIFPDYIRSRFVQAVQFFPVLQEIRLRAEREVILKLEDGESYIGVDGSLQKTADCAWRASQKDLEAILNHICSYSLYAFADELKQGFLTIPGGHRVGVAGQVILEQDQVRNMKNIRFLNIRISHQIPGAADGVIPYLFEGNRLMDTLIVSPPGCGKTTLLRDIVRQVSNGNSYAEGMDVAVVDERSEIAGCYLGMPQNDVGLRTDILDACPKAVGMMMVIRSMAPKAVAVDELGCEEDIQAVLRVIQCGSRILATIHGDSVEDLRNKKFLEKLLISRVFGRYVVMGRQNGRCCVTKIYDREFRRCSGW